MHQRLIQSITEEVRAALSGNYLGKVFQLTPLSFALDIGGRGSLLFISAEPASPRFYLIRRKTRDLEKLAIQLSHFGQLLKARVGGGCLTGCDKDSHERIVRLTFRVDDDSNAVHYYRLVAQLTGRAANLFVLDELNRIVGTLRSPKGPGQSPGEYYLPPPRHDAEILETSINIADSPSQVADEYFQKMDESLVFDSRVNNLRNRLLQTKNQKIKLRKNLEKDLVEHGDPETHKRLGNLLLANVETAVRNGNIALIQDFYSDNTPTLEVDVDESMSIQDAAARSFRQYAKAKRAHEEIGARLKLLEREISQLEQREQHLSRIARDRDVDALGAFDPAAEVRSAERKSAKQEQRIPGVRSYVSTDGYEILVGRAARDNDNLTFRIARPNDLWLHAGDYPGSHVVVRNPTRKEIPQRTVIEAAQLAGRFSQASEDSKVVIHYTERKFLSKPKGTAPGLVRMSRFRSITVEPKESVKRL